MAISTKSNDWICLFILSFVICLLYVNTDPIPTPNSQSANHIPAIIIQSAVAKGAVCLDGSPPAYHFSPGKDEDASNWLIYLQGGGWCTSNDAYSTPDFSVQSCPNRAAGELGSSVNMKLFEFTGFFGTNENDTYFYKWNRVVIRYCDGGSFAGDVEKPDPVTKLYYRGARIFEVVVDELMAKGMNAAKNVIFAGGSAGGLGVLVHCDNFTSRFPKGVRVKCLSDCSLFLVVKDPRHAKFFNSVFRDVVALHVIILSSSPPGLYFKQQIISALPHSSPTKGFIVTSHFGHSFAIKYYKKKMFADQNSKTIESAFYDWYFDQDAVNLIDPSNMPYY
nr:pectin acetylesterase 8-like [Ipomoea batatas]